MNRNKKLLKKILVAGICTAMTANTSAPVFAADASTVKDENVYATLEQDGTVSGIYVINEFSSEEGGKISDYGDYSSLKNLTDQSEISMENGQITAEIPKGKFYYQGNMEEGELPWNVSIRYFLNDKEISAEELAGKSGDLKIVIRTNKNPNGNKVFFENYLLQATVALNTEKCSDIRAEGATAGNAGVNRQLVYSILPGEEKEIEIAAKVQDFEMDGITFQGVPMSLGISEDMLDEVELSDQTKELTDAVVQLDDGVGELKKGTEAAADGGNQLAGGIAELAKGTGQLNLGGSVLAQGSSELVGGTRTLHGGIEQYAAGVDGFALGVQQYVAGAEMLSQGAKMLAPLENLPLVDDAVVQMYQAVTQGNEQQGIPSLQAGAESLSNGLHMILEQVKLLENSTDMEKLQETVEMLAQIQGMTEQLSETLRMLSENLGGSADMVDAVIVSHKQVLEDLNEQIKESNQKISGIGAALANQVNTRIDANNEAVKKANEKIGGVNTQIAEINSQIDAVNGRISDSANHVNGQIDKAVAAVQSALANGQIDSETANQIIAGLNGSRVGQETVGKLDGVNIDPIPETEHVEAPETEISKVQMPEEDKTVTGALDGLEKMSESLKSAAEEFDGVSAQLKQAATGMESSIPSEGDGNGIAQLSQALQAACDGADGLEEGVNGIGTALGQLSRSTASFDEASAGVTALNKGFEELCKNNSLLLEGSGQLINSRSELVAGAAVLVSGAGQISSGAGALSQGISVLHQGVALLDANTGTLTDGLAQLDEGTGKLKEGTEEFREQTDHMDEKISEEIEKLLDEMTDEEFEAVSFTSEKNSNIGLVQFAITTEGIKISEEEEEVVQEKEEGFGDRLKQLFR